jgi:hypothetical protein
MGEGVVREYQHLRLSRDICLGLREAVRPLVDPAATFAAPSRVMDFCARLYLAHFSLESDPDLKDVDFPIDQDEVMIINNFVSTEDGEWAKDVLHQTRQVLYELITGREAVRLASHEDVQRLGVSELNLDPADEGAPDQPEEPQEGEEAKA